MSEDTNNTEITETNEMSETEKLEAHYKALLNKATSEAAEFRRKYTSTLTEAEKAQAEREERDKEIQEELTALRRDKEVARFNSSLIGNQVSAATASVLSEAVADGNKDAIIEAIGSLVTELKKAYKIDSIHHAPTPDGQGGTETVSEELEFAKALGRERATANRTEVLKKYTK